jgi:hypothetical protein
MRLNPFVNLKLTEILTLFSLTNMQLVARSHYLIHIVKFRRLRNRPVDGLEYVNRSQLGQFIGIFLGILGNKVFLLRLLNGIGMVTSVVV